MQVDKPSWCPETLGEEAAWARRSAAPPLCFPGASLASLSLESGQRETPPACSVRSLGNLRRGGIWPGAPPSSRWPCMLVPPGPHKRIGQMLRSHAHCGAGAAQGWTGPGSVACSPAAQQLLAASSRVRTASWGPVSLWNGHKPQTQPGHPEKVTGAALRLPLPDARAPGPAEGRVLETYEVLGVSTAGG